jgi:hypothetical protein
MHFRELPVHGVNVLKKGVFKICSGKKDILMHFSKSKNIIKKSIFKRLEYFKQVDAFAHTAKPSL